MTPAQRQIETQEEEFRVAARELLDLLPIQKGKLLDIGCGIGWLVAEANKRGFSAVGIDLKKEYIEAGKKYLQVDLRAVSLENFSTKEKFDVVILKHVLEHIVDPENFLKKVSKLMKAGAIIVISGPNIHSLMARIFLEKWYGLVPLEHRWQFTKYNLPPLLETNGFTVENIVLSNMWYKVPGFKGILFKLILLAADLTNSGDLINVIARKND